MRDRLIEILSVPIHPRVGADPSEVLADYLLDNNVTIPPVSVGQKIYLIRKPIDRAAWIDECKITYLSVHYFKDGKSIVFSGYNFAAAECDIGIAVFLTREEAEQALERIAREEMKETYSTEEQSPEWQRSMLRTFGGDADV